MEQFKNTIIVTGGAGFIGSHLVKRLVKRYPETRIVNVDALTYAGNLENLTEVEAEPNYVFVKADICDEEAMTRLFREYEADGVIHLAAESHVDRSIADPLAFVRTNVLGTITLLQAPSSTGNRCRRDTKAKSSTMCPPMRYMVRLSLATACLWKRPVTILTVPIHRRRRRATISFVPGMTLTGCRPL